MGCAALQAAFSRSGEQRRRLRRPGTCETGRTTAVCGARDHRQAPSRGRGSRAGDPRRGPRRRPVRARAAEKTEMSAAGAVSMRRAAALRAAPAVRRRLRRRSDDRARMALVVARASPGRRENLQDKEQRHRGGGERARGKRPERALPLPLARRRLSHPLVILMSARPIPPEARTASPFVTPLPDMGLAPSGQFRKFSVCVFSATVCRQGPNPPQPGRGLIAPQIQVTLAFLRAAPAAKIPGSGAGCGYFWSKTNRRWRD